MIWWISLWILIILLFMFYLISWLAQESTWWDVFNIQSQKINFHTAPQWSLSDDILDHRHKRNSNNSLTNELNRENILLFIGRLVKESRNRIHFFLVSRLFERSKVKWIDSGPHIVLFLYRPNTISEYHLTLFFPSKIRNINYSMLILGHFESISPFRRDFSFEISTKKAFETIQRYNEKLMAVMLHEVVSCFVFSSFFLAIYFASFHFISLIKQHSRKSW